MEAVRFGAKPLVFLPPKRPLTGARANQQTRVPCMQAMHKALKTID
jgi:hypothetical protein